MRIFIFLSIILIILINNANSQWQLRGLEGKDVTKILPHPYKEHTLFASSSLNSINYRCGFYKSTDLGNNWDTLITNVSPTDFVINYQDANIIYLVGGVPYGVYKSTDGGNTWFSSSNGIIQNIGTVTYSIAMDPINPNVLYCGTLGPMGGDLYKTTNGGEIWYTPSEDSTLFYYGAYVIEFDKYKHNMLYVGRIGLHRSTDGGINFEFAGYENGGGIYSLKFGRSSDEMYATSSWGINFSVGVFKTTDGGLTWQNLWQGFNGSTSVRDAAINITETEYVYIGIESSVDTTGVYVKIDEEPWTLIGLNGLSINSLIIKDDLLYAGTSNGIYVRDLITDVNEQSFFTKKDFLLYPLYPNPFNPTTNIRFTVSYPAVVSLKILNALGTEVKELLNQFKPVGTYEISFDGEGLPTGIYFCTLQSENFTQTRKMVLIK